MMKRILLLGFILALASDFAIATTTVTGNLKDLTGTAVTGNVFVRFSLRGCGGNNPRVGGTALIAPVGGGVWYKDFVPDGTGAISGTLYSTRDAAGTGNGEIECGGSYTAAWYGMQVWNNGKAGPELPVAAKNGATLNISNVTPISTNPVVVAPTGDTTYLRIDAGNSPVTGSVAFNAGLNSTSIGATTPGTGAFTTLSATGATTTAGITDSGTSSFKTLNNVRYADQFAGATADVKIAACIAALPVAGGVCDARGFGAGNQTIAATVTISSSSAPITVLFDPSTVFVPSTASTNMFALGDKARVSGLNIDTSGITYTGNAIANAAQNITSWSLDHARVKMAAGASGACLSITATGPTQSVVFTETRDFRCYGGSGTSAIYLGNSGNGWVNGNKFYGVRVWDAQYGVQINLNGTYASGAQISNNAFYGYDYEADNLATALSGVYIVSAGGTSRALFNNFYLDVWDLNGGKAVISPDSTTLACSNEYHGMLVTQITDTNKCTNPGPNRYYDSYAGNLVTAGYQLKSSPGQDAAYHFTQADSGDNGWIGIPGWDTHVLYFYGPNGAGAQEEIAQYSGTTHQWNFYTAGTIRASITSGSIDTKGGFSVSGTSVIDSSRNGSLFSLAIGGGSAITNSNDLAPWGANGVSAGSITLSGGAASHTFTAAYTAAPICTATDTTAANAVKVTSTTTAVSVTGTTTDVINWICSPAKN